MKIEEIKDLNPEKFIEEEMGKISSTVGGGLRLMHYQAGSILL